MKDDKVFLRHILDEINFLLKETKNLEFNALMENDVLKRACARSLEIIGEAAKNLSDDLKEKHGDIDWKKVSGMRNKIIHYYFGVNWDIVWNVIKEKLPELKEKIENIFKELEQ